MKRKRHQRSGSDGLMSQPVTEDRQEVEVEDEDRLERLLEAAGAAMPEASDGDGDAPVESRHEHSDNPVSDSKVVRNVVAETEMAIGVEAVEEELALTEMVPNMRRCGLCGLTTDGEPAADNPSDLPDGLANGSLKPQDEGCLADVTLDTKKSDGFGTETGWLGRLLGPLGEQFGVGGVWVHENCAIWSPEVYFSGFGRLKNVKAALRRGRLLRCSLCNHPGATIGCRVDRCPQNYHLPCARAEGCMFNHRKYLMACYDHSHLFKRRRKKRYWVSKSRTAHQGGIQSEHSNPPRISKTQRRGAAAAARLKDIEAEERYLDKAEEDEEFVRRERKRLQRDLAQIAPVKLGGGSHANNQGIAPEGWDSVAGLQDVVQCLKEMVTLPLLYPEAFTRLGISAPRGVLLHGHPGTGKTLVVRALAGACSRGGQQVAYFARKGADILGKYVGDSERQLRLLFQVAEQCQPAIIFFDEIDGLAPSRCGDRDQTQSSVVSTLLALMDGLSSRGSVVVIGATNRPDSLDPALRRPGRFDREIYFPLPSTEDRASILRLHTRTWNPAPSPDILSVVAKATPGFAGADLQALCVEAAMTALRRVIPLKYILDSAALKGPLETILPSLPSIQVKAKDWAKAVARAPLPCSRRLASSSLTQVPAAPLPRHLAPVFLPILVELLVKLGLDARVSLPPLLAKAFTRVKLALKAASNLQNTDGDFTGRGDNLPECWRNMVLDCFKETPSVLANAMEDAFLDPGIMVDTYGAPRFSQPASTTLHFANVGTGADKGRVASRNLEDPSGNEGQIPTSIRQILSDDNLDEVDVAVKQKWPGCKFRILLLGGAEQGQKFVAGAFINGFEGLAQTRTLSLPAMLMEGSGDMEQGLIYIIVVDRGAVSGEARRSAPCVLYMPKIEDWVVRKEHDGIDNKMSGSMKHPEGFGISNAGAEVEGRSEANISDEDDVVLDVSVPWKLMKQQLQTMPPDTQLMLLATCESGVDALPLEVVNYFSPQLEKASKNSSLYPAQVSPCILMEFSSSHDTRGLLERASQDIAKAMASGFGSRMARLRDEYNAGCSAEKPKLSATAGHRLSTSVQQIIADKVSQIRTRVREDLGRDLRNIGQEWARNLGGAPYANDFAKVFGMDVGRGLGLDLGLEFRNLESGLVEEFSRECSGGVEERVTGGVEKCVVGASRLIGGQSNEQDSVDLIEQEHQMSSHCEGTRFVISGGRSLGFTEADGFENDSMKNTLQSRDVCASADLVKETQNHQLSRDMEQFEGQPICEPSSIAMERGSKQAVAEESTATWSAQRKALQSAIAFYGFRILRDPQLAGLRNATTMLRRVPVVDVHDCKDSGTFNWETLEYQTSSGRRKDEVPESEYVRGLTAVGFKACRGIYRTGREVEYEFRRVIESLYERVQQKIDSGKDSLQYFHLTTQAATLVDLMATWVLEVRKLEIAANMHSLPIAKNILEDEYCEEHQQDHQDSDQIQGGDEAIDVKAVNGEHHPVSTEVLLTYSGEGGSEQVENGFISGHGSKIKFASSSNGDAQTVEISGLAEGALKKDGFIDEMPTTPNVRESQPIANGIVRGALGCFPGQNSLFDAAHVSAEVNCKDSLLPDRNGARSQQTSQVVETTVESDLPIGNIKLLSSFRDPITSEACLQKGTRAHAALPLEGSTSVSPVPKTKYLRQTVRFKPDCYHQLEIVVREFLNISCNADTSNSSVEVLHDLITGCASTALAASQNVLNKSEKTNITRQVILQWAGLTCHCGGDKGAEAEVGATWMGGSPMQLPFNGSPTPSNDQATPISQASSRKSKKRKKSRLSFSDIQAPPAKRLSICGPEAFLALPGSSPLGLVSPMKQANSKKSYTCLRPVIMAIQKMVNDSASSKDLNRKLNI